MMTLSTSLLATLFTALAAGPNSTALSPPTTGDGAAGDFFGVQTYVDREWLLVGAYGDMLNSTEVFTGVQSGTVKCYTLKSGIPVPVQILQPPQPTENTLFGDEIVRSGNWLAVSAPRFSSGVGLEAGGVFLFRLEGTRWQYFQTLVPTTTRPLGRFGEGLYAGDGKLWVGAPQRGSGGEVAVYGLSESGATLQTIVPAPSGQTQFGQALAGVPSGPVVVGAPGSAAVYLLDPAQPQAPGVRLSGPVSFGTMLAASATALIVAAPDDQAGSVHRWSRSGVDWVPQPVLRPSAGQSGDQFGGSLSIAGTQLYIGAPGTDRGADYDVGAVYRASVSGGESSLSSRTMPADLPLSTLFGSSIASSTELNLAWVGAPLAEISNQRSGKLLSFGLNQLGDSSAMALDDVDRGGGAQLFRFGQSAAIDGEWAIAGAFLADTSDGADAGSAYVYRRLEGQWVLDTQLRPLDAQVDQRFGFAVDISGDTAVVGAYWDVIGEQPEQGSAYVFRRSGDGWVQEAKLIARDGRSRDLFGASVAISGGLIAVAAPGVDLQFADAGAVYTYRRGTSGWTLTNPRLVPPAPTTTTVFGQSIALAGTRLAVGAPGLNAPTASDVGAVYTFRFSADQWVVDQTLDSPAQESSALFGFGVGLGDKSVIVGAPGVDLNGLQFVGAAYLYPDCTRGCLDASPLLQPDPQEGDQFGISVTANTDFAVVGAHGIDRNGAVDVGGAIAFDARTLEVVQQFAAPGNVALGTYGRVVDIDAQQQFIVGSPLRAGVNPAEGAVWIETLSRELFADGFE